jgi:hypothetical protein
MAIFRALKKPKGTLTVVPQMKWKTPKLGKFVERPQPDIRKFQHPSSTLSLRWMHVPEEVKRSNRWRIQSFYVPALVAVLIMYFPVWPHAFAPTNEHMQVSIIPLFFTSIQAQQVKHHRGVFFEPWLMVTQ